MSQVSTNDGTKLYLKDFGTGRPVIMAHGWPLTADTFDDLALALANAGLRAISYDRRGFGRSDQPWTGYDYDTLADDLAAVMEHTGAQDATLLGFSMGGGEVARYLTRHGSKKVRQAVLVASVLPFRLQTADNPDGVEQAAFDATAQALKEDRAHFFGGFFKKFFGVGTFNQPVTHEALEWAQGLAMQAGLHPTLACAKAFSSTDFRGDLESFNLPTLLIHGTDDQIVPIESSSRLALAGIADGRLLEYEGAPHGLFASHKTRLAADVLEFVRD